jgi:hypothetical protein
VAGREERDEQDTQLLAAVAAGSSGGGHFPWAVTGLWLVDHDARLSK